MIVAVDYSPDLYPTWTFIVIDDRGSCEIAPGLGACRAKIALDAPRTTSYTD